MTRQADKGIAVEASKELASDVLEKGQWVVHKDHGTGQVIGRSELALGGEAKFYLKIKTRSAMLWLPIEKCTRRWLRRPKTANAFEEALAILDEPAQALPRNRRARQAMFDDITAHSAPVDIARSLRDLRAWRRQRQEGFAGQDRETWDRLRNAFLSEWTATTGIDWEEADARLSHRLQMVELPEA